MTLRGLAFAVLLFAAAGCKRDDTPDQTTFYDRKIGPILQQSCAASPTKSGCHVEADERGNALGNLDVSSYEKLTLRQDLFVNYGPYGLPGLLLKVVPQNQLSLTSWKAAAPTIVTTNIAHVGGSLIDITTPSFAQLQKWIENGAAENNAPQLEPVLKTSACSEVLGNDAAFDPALDPAAAGSAGYETFRTEINGILGRRCAASNCHGSPANSLKLTCGTTPEQERWNYFAASDYVSVDPASSELLRRALSPAAGGTFHEGGAIFGSQNDAEYQAVLRWATEKGGPTNEPTDPGFVFFSDRVQPMLVKRGCMMLGCHSPAIFHDYRLRGGSGGHFGLPATRKNYELTLDQLALESPDPTASRLIRKNLAPGGGGILHRGGPLFAGRPATCDLAAAETGPLDEQNEYCVIAAWFEMERAARMTELSPLSGVAFVRRPPAAGPGFPQDYDVYSPGAEVILTAATLGISGDLTLAGETSLSSLCSLVPATSDARRPAVSWDGRRIAFSARSGPDAPFRIYVVEAGTCSVEPTIDAAPLDDNGQPVPANGAIIHNFDPAFSPDGRIVFTSTRGNVMNTGVFSYQGPQRTPADPAKFNANLYVLEDGAIRQLTFLLNQELSPSFMRDGRVILVAEKRAPEFYQLAGRRINLDGGDYHPLFGQRSTVGYTQFTDVVELSDKNLAAILSDRGAAHGAGALAIVNRSIGVDQLSTTPEDYTQDPDAINWPNEAFFQHSVQILNTASGRLDATQGAYRNPSPLPNGQLLVSYAANVVNLAEFSGNFGVFVVDPLTGDQLPLIDGPEDELWPVAVYAKQNNGVFRSRLDEANGATEVVTGEGSERAEVKFMDVPVFTSLLFQNTRSGRILPTGPVNLQIWESLPPEPGVTSFAAGGPFVTTDQYGPVYVRRQLLGGPEMFEDGSAAVRIRGGVPILLRGDLKLAGDPGQVTQFQREEMQFYPGERVRQSFRREFFNGLCAGCHGSLSGYENEIVTNPDILTQASSVMARGQPGTDLTGAPQGEPVGP